MLLQQRVTAAILVIFSAGAAGAQSARPKAVPFDAFLRAVKRAEASEFLAKPDSRIRDAAAFEEMRQHILHLYRGVHVKHTFLVDSQTVDCVPADEQPGVRGAGMALRPGPAACEEGTIPMRRVTLEQLSHWETLQGFLQKGPGGPALPPVPGKF